jgi:hypothetical protein
MMKFNLTSPMELIREVIRNQRQKDDNETLQHVGRFQMRCNLCNRTFDASSRYLRFCKTCRITDEIYRYAEWLPGELAL